MLILTKYPYIHIEKVHLIINMKSPYDIIRRFIEAIIIPQYPEIESIGYIDSYNVGGVRMYSVGLIMNDYIEPDVQTKIHKEIQNLFMMASLDKDNGFKRDFIMSYFDFQDGEGYRIESFPD